jgi:hypothetical protein
MSIGSADEYPKGEIRGQIGFAEMKSGGGLVISGAGIASAGQTQPVYLPAREEATEMLA